MSFADLSRRGLDIFNASKKVDIVYAAIFSIFLGTLAGMGTFIYFDSKLMIERSQLKQELALAKSNVDDLHKELKEFRIAGEIQKTRASTVEDLVKRIQDNTEKLDDLSVFGNNSSYYIELLSCKTNCGEGIYLDPIFLSQEMTRLISNKDYEGLALFKKRCDLVKQIVMDSITLSKF